MMNGWGWTPGSMWGYGYGGGLVMILIGVAVIVGIVLLIRWAVKHPGGGDESSNGSPTAREILDERYAKGDISREEYVQMKSDLEHK